MTKTSADHAEKAKAGKASGLSTYHKKRDFTQTAEPRGAVGAEAGHSYLIQKHDARRLHYDLRLEMDGVLKSWAVTKGPSLVPGEKRLAVHVEDHPLDYGTFEGTIPKGQYGGGTVMLWDRGSWSPVGDADRGYRKGHLEFEIHGEKLHGRWHLVRMHPRPGEKADNWLLIKAEDEEARGEAAADILEEKPDSVKTGRDLDEIASDAPADEKPMADDPKPKRRRKARIAGKESELPPFVEPELATLVARTPSGKDWLHEVKFDGYRLQARVDHDERPARRVRLMTRSGLDWTERFGGRLVAALDGLPTGSAIIDGELVVENDVGASTFSLLQQDLSEGRSDRFTFYAFDLLFRDGRDLRDEPLRMRTAELADLMKSAKPPLRLSEPFDVDGAAMLQQACRLGLEGVISKRASAPYCSGRGRDWVKSKCSSRQEFVIGGYVPSTAYDHAIGSLVLGVYEDGKLRHVGRVGTGYSRRVAEDLEKTLSALKRERSPFAGKLTAEERRGVIFVAPDLVAEVEFRGWTGDEHIRQGSFRGLREDKAAKEIVREEPLVPEDEAGNSSAKPAAGRKPPAVPKRSGIKLTHPDRIYWPEDGITKQALADYYGAVWTSIAPFVIGRPLALLRCPDGITQSCFFQKHAWQGINRAIRITKDADGEELLSIDDYDGLIALAQSGAIEIHPWQAPLADLERPDMMIFDLDPGEGVTFADIVAGARAVKERLEAVGLPAFVKTSGGKGLHVTVPLKPAAGWDEVKGFAKALADALSADDPDHYIAVATKARRDGRIFVDYLRNGRGATAIVAYGVRARQGAGVSMPVDWNDLDSLTGAADFTLENTPERLANRDRDPWDGFRKAAVPLDAEMLAKIAPSGRRRR